MLYKVNKLKYSWYYKNTRCVREIKCRIDHANYPFQKMKSVLYNKSLYLNVRMRVLKCYIEPVLLHDSLSWNVSEGSKKNWSQ